MPAPSARNRAGAAPAMNRRETPTRVAFLRREPTPLVSSIDQSVTRGRGWINIGPDLDEVDPRALGRPSFFSGRGPTIPLGTFVPGSGRADHQVGLEHGAGKGAARLLAEAGLELPPGCRLVQDHPRRGLILALAPTTEAAVVARLLLSVAVELTPIPLPEQWTAEIYLG